MSKRKNSWMLGLAALIASTLVSSAQAGVVLSQNFTGAGLPAGWTTATGTGAATPSLWSKPGDISNTFPSATGDNSYFQDSVGSFFEAQNTIADFLITPVITLNSTATISFLLRADPTPGVEAAFPDDLRILFAAGGSSTFTLLKDLNPTFSSTGISTDWTLITLTGIPAGVASGRIAFEYFVDNTLIHGDQIGIDAITVTIPEPGSLALLGLGIAAAAIGMRSRRRQ